MTVVPFLVYYFIWITFCWFCSGCCFGGGGCKYSVDAFSFQHDTHSRNDPVRPQQQRRERRRRPPQQQQQQSVVQSSSSLYSTTTTTTTSDTTTTTDSFLSKTSTTTTTTTTIDEKEKQKKKDPTDVVLLLQRAFEIVGIVTQGVLLPVYTSIITQGLPTVSSSRNTIATSIQMEDDHDNNNYDDNDDDDDDLWNQFWKRPLRTSSSSNDDDDDDGTTILKLADTVALTCERLGPTYVKLGQALSSRPDIIAPAVAQAMGERLQDNMAPFDDALALQIIQQELQTQLSIQQQSQSKPKYTIQDIQNLILSMQNNDDDDTRCTVVGAASIGQVYKGHLPGYGDVAIKVQRPGIREIVERDAQLFDALAHFVESIPSLSIFNMDSTTTTTNSSSRKSNRLIAAKVVNAADEFMSRILEELDYRREVRNMQTFSELYSHRRPGLMITKTKNKHNQQQQVPDSTSTTSSSTVRVVVPEVIQELCTEKVIVMEWIEGTKLTSFGNKEDENNEQLKQENLAIIEEGIQCTLSQLLDTGILHADPHAGNLLKVKRDQYHHDNGNKNTKNGNESSLLLGYLDFGILSTVPMQVRDGLVCAVVQLVFGRNVNAVADLFGELQLLPPHVLDDPIKRTALVQALQQTFDDVLEFETTKTTITTPNQKNNNNGSSSTSSTSRSTVTTDIPKLRFDNLLGRLATLISKFEFELPPYFLNNARALGTLEGMARNIDPEFNVLRVLYPYALSRLLTNPSGSEVVDSTLLSLIQEEILDRRKGTRRGVISIPKIQQLLDDIAKFTGNSRRQVFMDVLQMSSGGSQSRVVRSLPWDMIRGQYYKSSSRKNRYQRHRKRLAGKDSNDFRKYPIAMRDIFRL